MQKLFIDAQPMPTAGCLPKPGSAEYDWWLSERRLLDVASGEDAAVAQAAQVIAQPPSSSTACPRERGEAACGGCQCA